MHAPALKVVTAMSQSMVIKGPAAISGGWGGGSFVSPAALSKLFFLLLFTFLYCY